MKIIPELRFPEFENEEEWEYDELGNHCEITTGKLDANAMVENGKYRFYTCAKDYYYIDNYAFDTNALLISGNGAHVGYIHHYNGKFNAYQRTYVLDNFDKNIHFIQFYLERNLKSRIATEKKDGNTPYIVRSTLSEMKILSPKNEIEQQKIASCLSSLDELITAQNQKLEALKAHKKGLMQNLFPQEGETVPKYRFKEFEKDGEWVEKIFDDILDITRLAGYEYSEYWKEDENKEIIALRGYNIGKGTLLFHNLGYISKELSIQLNRSKLYKGDIVYPCVGTIGNAVVVEEDNKYHIQQNIAKLTPKKDVSPYFISQFLMSHLGMREVNKFNATSSQPNVLVGSLRNFKICIPNIAEQQKIASCLSSLDALITAQAEKIEQLKQHKKGLMQGLFPKLSEL